MTKKVQFSKPPRRPIAKDPTQWVEARELPAATKAASVPMKRFTIDVPADLHARIKAQCAVRGEKMADVIRAMLIAEFPES